MAVTYYLGVDGGTTRTKAVVGDAAGHIVGSSEGGASNYQVVGLEAAMSGITDAVQGALTAADLSISQIERAVFGLSGMDLPMHREVLDAALTTAFPGLIFDLVNDTWIMLREEPFAIRREHNAQCPADSTILTTLFRAKPAAPSSDTNCYAR